MNIEQFVEQSTGEWRSMRSGHSLAFQQFEEVLSIVEINALAVGDAGSLTSSSRKILMQQKSLLLLQCDGRQKATGNLMTQLQ